MTRSNRTRTGFARNAGRDTRLTSSSLLTQCNSSKEWITLAELDKLPNYDWTNDPVVQAFVHITARIILDTDVPPPNHRLYQEYINYLDNSISVVLTRGAPADTVLIDEMNELDDKKPQGT
jgi:hypothetical protein